MGARGGDLMPGTIPAVGLLIVRSDPGVGTFDFDRQKPGINSEAVTKSVLPWVPEVFLACGGKFRCWPKADTSSAVGRSHERRSREKKAFRAGHY